MMPATTPLPIRSALLVPGHDERACAPPLASAADALYVDLEAAVPHHRLDDARELVRESHAGLVDAGKLVVVRVNAVSSDHIEADVAAVVREGLYGIALAKIDRVRRCPCAGPGAHGRPSVPPGCPSVASSSTR